MPSAGPGFPEIAMVIEGAILMEVIGTTVLLKSLEYEEGERDDELGAASCAAPPCGINIIVNNTVYIRRVN